MSKAKKKLTDDQCALRKFVATEVGMTKNELKKEIEAAITVAVNQQIAKIDIHALVEYKLRGALGDPVLLSARVDKLISAKIRKQVESEIKRLIKIPETITIKLK